MIKGFIMQSIGLLLSSITLSFFTYGYMYGCENTGSDSNQGRFKRPVITLYRLEKGPHRGENKRSQKKNKAKSMIYVSDKVVNEEALHYHFPCYFCSVSGVSHHPIQDLSKKNK